MKKAPPPRPRILLAEEETLPRAAFRRLLEDEFRVVGAVPDVESLRRAATRLQPDVVVAGLSLLLARGVDEARVAWAAAENDRLVVVAREPRAAVAKAPLLGACAWVLRSSTADEFRAAVRAAAAGRPVSSRSPAGRAENAAGAASGVTPRAAEVVRLIARGKAMKQVAADLGISVRTVAFHKYKTMRCLGLDSSAALVHYAVRNDLL
jgi:DNA-binding NarL/FixJ family response regulator